ncbi:MAG: hypothetical protein ABSF64_20155 [Bryobacteraceae bacterium]
MTPREWKRDNPTRIDWAKLRSDERQWRKVLAMDAIDLQQWLERCEAVVKDFASEVKGLVQTDGALSVREFWELYAAAFRPRLTEQVVLCGRQKP